MVSAPSFIALPSRPSGRVIQEAVPKGSVSGGRMPGIRKVEGRSSNAWNFNFSDGNENTNNRDNANNNNRVLAVRSRRR